MEGNFHAEVKKKKRVFQRCLRDDVKTFPLSCEELLLAAFQEDQLLCQGGEGNTSKATNVFRNGRCFGWLVYLEQLVVVSSRGTFEAG